MSDAASLLALIAILRRASPRGRQFNMLRALRSVGDEVRLHSRFIAALIDPLGHTLGHDLLSEFLDEIGVPASGEHSLLRHGLVVQVEFAGIDILITNSHGQAVLIENKVYAGDQERQLRRYYDLLRDQRYSSIFVRYLSIDGRPPSSQSLAGLEEELPGAFFQCASYADQIRAWLRRCEGIAVREIPLRESISQYAAVIDELTGNDQEKAYMDAMVETLLIGNNMVLARDVRVAYLKGLVELQDRLWIDIENAFMREHERMFSLRTSKSLATSPERTTVIEKYYRPTARSNRYFGFYFSIPGWDDACVCIELEAQIYTGVYCEKVGRNSEYNRAFQVLDRAGITGERNESWPVWRWTASKYELQEPNEVTLAMLTDEHKRKAFADACVEDVATLWRAMEGAS